MISVYSGVLPSYPAGSIVLDTRYEFIFASDVTEAANSELLGEGRMKPIGDVRPAADLANGAPDSPSKTNGS